MSKEEKLKNYKYTATDNSILCKLFLNRYYTYIVEFVPLSIAPNSLTLIGLILSLISLFLTLITDPYLNNQKYPIVKLINAFFLFAYQTFDAIDGKQARRTNSSSPLGQLFDHGCDALVCFSTAITIASSLGLGNTSYLIMFLFSLISIYYFCCLEEYATDHFYLGYVNGPTEGIFAGILSHIVSFFCGKEAFDFLRICINFKYKKIEFSVPVLHIVVMLFISVTFVKLLYSMKGVFRTKSGIFTSLMNTHSLFMCLIIFMQVERVKENLIIFYIVILNFAFIFSRMTLELAYSHLKGEENAKLDFNHYIFVYSSCFALIYDFGIFLFFLMMLSSGVAYFERVIAVIKEICNILEIKCFQITKTKQE
ncbi:hypothetical protein GVAV_002263 [Gurleya vavrai]